METSTYCVVDFVGVFLRAVAFDPETETPPADAIVTAAPELEEGQGARWEQEAWVVFDLVDAPVVQAAAPAGPFRVTKPDMQRLLTAGQRRRIAMKRKEIAALPLDAYDPGTAEEPNPEFAPFLVALEDTLQAFDLPAEFIELDHPDTAAAMGLFRELDIIESDDEVARILAGIFPEA